jgi:hypothetical protein
MRIPISTTDIASLAVLAPSGAAPSGAAPSASPSHPGEAPIANAPALVFLHHKDVDPAMWGKKVPTYDSGSVRWYFLTYRLAVPHGAVMFLKAPDLEPQCQEVLDHFRRFHISHNTDRVRRHALVKYVNYFMDRLGLPEGDPPPREVIETVARMFDVGTSTVQKLVPKAPPPPDTPYKKEEEWFVLRAIAQLARVYAFKVPGAGPVSIKVNDCLIRHGKTMLFPKTCPVLGIDLVYDLHDKHAPGLVRIGRRDPTRPFSGSNVLVMSAKAFKAIEALVVPTTRKPKHPLTPEEVHMMDKFLA